MGDHTETVQVDFDPARITYSQLLDIFWEEHTPTRQSFSQQYMNAVFFHNDEQQKLAMASKSAMEKKLGKTIKSAVKALNAFTMAEDYHQKYLLKGHPLIHDIKRVYPNHDDLVNSRAAARLNGYAGRYGSSEQINRDMDNLGLSEHGKELLSRLQ